MQKIIIFFKTRKYLIGGLLFLIVFIIQIFMVKYFKNHESSEVMDLPVVQNVIEEKVETEEKQKYYVDLKGEIKKPGVYQIDEGKRLIDAIKMAGGLTKNADTSVNNLSMKVKDEMVVVIYSKTEIKSFSDIKAKEETLIDKCNESTNNMINDSCISKETNKLISINTASKEELMSISSIGESKALNIISYRETNGKFTSIDEIKNVNGIGEALYAKIKDNITI